MPVERPPRAPTSHITPQIRQAIFNWIERNLEYGVVQLTIAYMEKEAHPTHRDALIQLEARYGLAQDKLVTQYAQRVAELMKRYAKAAQKLVPALFALERPEDLLRNVPAGDITEAFLHCLPEPEFLTALEIGARSFVEQYGGHPDLFGYLEKAFRTSGLPYTASAGDGICWVGEPAIRDHAIEPALMALTDPRLSTARDEFDKARGHLRRGEFKDAGKWAGDAAETTMAILLGASGHPQPQTKHGTDLVQAKLLFDQLKSTFVGLLNEDRDKELIYAPMKVRNACGHGAGANPTRPDPAYVEAGVASAAVAITYLASKLP